MKAFAQLLEGLVFMPSRNGKIRLLCNYFDGAPDPDRGWALAALTGDLAFPSAKPAAIRDLVTARVDPVLFGWSYDFVGDLAETAALIWPVSQPDAAIPGLDEVVGALTGARRKDVPGLLEGWLDRCGPAERFALLKLITGGLRVGVSARLAKTALAQWSGTALDEIEEIWHGLEPPYRSLFAWLSGKGPQPDIDNMAIFRPLMLANPLEEEDIKRLDPAGYAAEWKWDGIRVQLSARGGTARLFSRTGDEISGVFPDLLDGVNFDAVLDGELLVERDGAIAPFNDLQQRLNRKTVTKAMLSDYPAWLRLYDILLEGGEDLRSLPFQQRRERLEAWYDRERPPRIDLSPLVAFETLAELRDLHEGARDNAIEGLMLKRWDSPYVAGRPKGPWFKWKRDPLTLDCVLMYAQRGHGKRSSFYSDYTFGAWRETGNGDGIELVPVGKAYFGFTDEELGQLDRWVRAHTVNRYGPVREVESGLVLEIAFDSVHPSNRHKSGLAMRFPRVSRIRWDKPAEEADSVATLAAMVQGGGHAA